jgi:hypothetical protein
MSESKRYGKVYVIEVTANKSQEKAIDALLTSIAVTVTNFCPTSKIKVRAMEQE